MNINEGVKKATLTLILEYYGKNVLQKKNCFLNKLFFF